MDLSSLIPLIVGIALGALGVIAWRRSPRPSPDDSARGDERAGAGPTTTPGAAPTPVTSPAESKATAIATAEPPPPIVDDVFTIAISLENTARKIPHPRDLLENARFQRAVEL